MFGYSSDPNDPSGAMGSLLPKARMARQMGAGLNGANPPQAAPAAAAPAQSTTIQNGGAGYDGSVPPPNSFAAPGMGVRGQLKRMFGNNALMGNGLLWQNLGQLGNEANQDWTSTYAQMAAPDFAHLNDAQNVAQGQLTSNLMSRGLGDSSAMAAGLGTLASQGAASRASLAANVQQQALARHDQLQNAYQQAISNLVLGHGQAGFNIANQLSQEALLKQQMEGDPFGQALGGLMGLGGSFLGSSAFGNLIGGAPKTPLFQDPTRNYGY